MVRDAFPMIEEERNFVPLEHAAENVRVIILEIPQQQSDFAVTPASPNVADDLSRDEDRFAFWIGGFDEPNCARQIVRSWLGSEPMLFEMAQGCATRETRLS